MSIKEKIAYLISINVVKEYSETHALPPEAGEELQSLVYENIVNFGVPTEELELVDL